VSGRHYIDAELMVGNADRHVTEDPGDMRIAEVSAYCAQVHATLAVAERLSRLIEVLQERT
jgi:hypothetical protein